MAKRKDLLRVAVICVVLQLCGAMKLQCTVTQKDGHWTYNLSHVAEVTSNPSSFDYSWSNASNVELANQEDSIGTVISHSVNTLVTSVCIPSVHFTAAKSEGRIETEYTSTCSTNCSFSTLSSVTAPQSQKNETAPSSSPESTDTDPWNTLKVVIPVLIVLLVLAVCFLCYKYRDGIRRMLSCSQGGILYRAGNRTNSGPQVVQV